MTSAEEEDPAEAEAGATTRGTAVRGNKGSGGGGRGGDGGGGGGGGRDGSGPGCRPETAPGESLPAMAAEISFLRLSAAPALLSAERKALPVGLGRDAGAGA